MAEASCCPDLARLMATRPRAATSASACLTAPTARWACWPPARRAAPPLASGVELVWATSYHVEPKLIEAFAERLPGLRGKVLFTAHSLPAPNEQYDREARATASAVAAL